MDYGTIIDQLNRDSEVKAIEEEWHDGHHVVLSLHVCEEPDGISWGSSWYAFGAEDILLEDGYETLTEIDDAWSAVDQALDKIHGRTR